MSEQNEKKRTTAPYLAFLTFLNALDNVAAHGVPNFIDRSSFPSFSGGAVAATLSAFRFFGLIDADGKPHESLHALAMNKDDRQKNIKALLEKYYSSLIALDLSRATPSQFDAEFSGETFGASGDTRVKAKTFFIKAAQFAEIPISKLLLNKARSSGPRKPKKPKTPAANGNNSGSSTQHTVLEQQPPPNGAAKTVQLRGGGSLSMSASVDLLSLKGADRAFVFEIIDLLDKYESEGSDTSSA